MICWFGWLIKIWKIWGIQESSIFVHGVHIFEVNFRSCHPKSWWKFWRILPRNDLMAPTEKVSSFDSHRFHVMLIDSGSLHVANGFSTCCFEPLDKLSGKRFFFDRRMKLDWSMIMMLFNNYWVHRLGSHRSFHVISSLPVPSLDLSMAWDNHTPFCSPCRVMPCPEVTADSFRELVSWSLKNHGISKVEIRMKSMITPRSQNKNSTVTITTLRTTFQTTTRTTAATATPPTTKITP